MLTDKEGIEVNEHQAKCAILYRAFHARLCQSTPTENPLLLHTRLHSNDNLQELEMPFTHEDIDEVVKNLPADKSSGPDGFNVAFLKACCDIIAPNFYNLVEDFYEGKVNLQSNNYSFITLIPKRDDAVAPNDFRPISLLSCTIKIITKLLASMLWKHILNMIHNNHYGFLNNRCIQDCLAWSYEFLRKCHCAPQARV